MKQVNVSKLCMINKYSTFDNSCIVTRSSTTSLGSRFLFLFLLTELGDTLSIFVFRICASIFIRLSDVSFIPVLRNSLFDFVVSLGSLSDNVFQVFVCPFLDPLICQVPVLFYGLQALLDHVTHRLDQALPLRPRTDTSEVLVEHIVI